MLNLFSQVNVIGRKFWLVELKLENVMMISSIQFSIAIEYKKYKNV
jgi:hypothetical protein